MQIILNEIIRIAKSIYLSEDELVKIQKKYKFSTADIALLKGVNITIENIIEPRMSYVLAEDDFVEEIIGCKPDKKYAVACVSLGGIIDELSNVYLKAKEVMIPTIIDDICMEIMAKAYSIMAGDISKRYGLWVKSYMFPGDQIPLFSSKNIISYLKEENVSCNDLYILNPIKSVAMFMELTGTECEKGHLKVCDSCSNTKCIYRNT